MYGISPILNTFYHRIQLPEEEKDHIEFEIQVLFLNKYPTSLQAASDWKWKIEQIEENQFDFHFYPEKEFFFYYKKDTFDSSDLFISAKDKESILN